MMVNDVTKLLHQVIGGSSVLRDLFTDDAESVPRWRYFEDLDTQTKYCWTTQARDGLYFSWIYRPYGPGSRSGNATKWKQDHWMEHDLRREAKDLAQRMWKRSA